MFVADGGDCLKVVRVECGTLREIANELIRLIGRRQLPPGSTILLGSLSQLEKEGSAFYCNEWRKYRTLLKDSLGEVIVSPLLPLVMEDRMGGFLSRSLVEVISWYDDLADSEAGILKGFRAKYREEFLSEVVNGGDRADGIQSLRLPVSLVSEGTMLYRSRLWGNLPNKLRAV